MDEDELFRRRTGDVTVDDRNSRGEPSHERLDPLLMALPDSLYVVDDSLRVVFFREGGTEAPSTPPEAVVGQSIVAGLSLEAAEIVRAAFEVARRLGHSLSAAYGAESPSGGRWHEASITRRLASDSNMTSFVVLVRDITDRVRRTLAAIEESEARFTAAFHDNRAPLAIRRRRDDMIIEVNAAFERLFGRTRAALVGQTTDCLGLFADLARRVPLSRSRVGEKDIAPHDGMFVDNEGRVRHVAIEVSDITIGGEDCSLAHITDQTARRESEAAAHASQMRLLTSERRLAEAHRIAGLGAFERDLVTGESWWSEQQYLLWGVAPDTPITHDLFLSLVHPDEREEMRRRVQRLIADGHWSVTFRIIRPDGDVRHVHSVATVIRNEEGEPHRIAGTNLDITEQTRADEELRASEERYRSVVEGALEGIYQTAVDGTVISVNQAFARILGYDSPADLVGRNLTDFYLDPAARRRIQTQLEDSDTIAGVELVWRNRGGARVVVEVSGRAARDPRGECTGYHGIARDVTTQRQREAALRVLSTGVAHLSGIALFDELAAQLALIVGADGAFVHKLVPGELPRLRTVSYVEAGVLCPADEFDVRGTASEAVLRGELVVIAEGVQQRFPNDGRLRAHGAEAFAATPLRIGDNQIIGLIGVVSRHALTDAAHVLSILQLFALRAAAELQRQRAEARFIGVFESAPDALVIADAQGRIVQVNDVAQRMFGYGREELLRLSVEDLMPEATRAAHVPLRAEFLARGRSRKMGSAHSLVRARRADGSEFRVEISLSPLLSDEGPMVVAAVRDMTEHLQGVAQRERLEEQLRHRHRLEALGTLAGGIAHDLNNMLTPIVANVEFARDTVVRGSPLERCIDEISLAADRATKLVAQILTFSRKQQPSQRAVTNVRAVLTEVATLVQKTLPQGATIEVAPTGEAPSVVIDPTQLHQVVMNLASNAVHALHPMGGEVVLKVDQVVLLGDASPVPALVPGRYARIQVIDNGVGIDQGTQARIFDPFFTTRKTGKGTGLGLAVVDGIIATNRGAITVLSTPGLGTTFTVYLPSSTTDRAETPADRQPDRQRGSGHLLVVDDDAAVLRVTSSLLERIGYTVKGCSSAEEAIRVFRASPAAFHGVVTDQNMPGMDGVALAQVLTATRANVPIILLSGNPVYTDMELADANIRYALHKPYSQEELATVLERAMRESRPA